MTSKILITLGVLIYSIIIPILEINHSHVFNPDWPAHARFYEVWQLATNMALGVLCLWLSWIKKDILIASLISISVMGGILIAHLMEGSYGGSVLSGNLSKTIMGLELAAFAAALVVIINVIALLLSKHASSRI